MPGSLRVWICLGIGITALVSMDAFQKPLDLDLWLNADLIQRQNILKNQFLAVLEEVSAAVSLEDLRLISTDSKGVKISKGNALLDFPFQVLDIIRDFDPNTGINIRLLNWIGVGFFSFVLLGAQRNNPAAIFLDLGYGYGLSDDKWDYENVVMKKNFTLDLSTIESSKLKFHHWFKPLDLPRQPTAVIDLFDDEVKKILEVLRLS